MYRLNVKINYSSNLIAFSTSVRYTLYEAIVRHIKKDNCKMMTITSIVP